MAKKEAGVGNGRVVAVVQQRTTTQKVDAFGGVEKVLEMIEDGCLSFKNLGKKVGCTGGTLTEWLRKNHCVQYAKSIERRYEGLANSIVDIAEEKAPLVPTTGATDSGFVAHQRLRIDARKWIVSKMLPKVYGDKITQEITGADGGAIKTEMQVSRKLSREEVMLELAARGLPQSVLISQEPSDD